MDDMLDCTVDKNIIASHQFCIRNDLEGLKRLEKELDISELLYKTSSYFAAHSYSETPMNIAASNGYIELFDYLFNNYGQKTGRLYKMDIRCAVESACMLGQLEILKYITSQGISLWKYCLVYAIRDCHLEIVKYLIEECGLNVNETLSYRDTPVKTNLITFTLANKQLNPIPEDKALEVIKYLIETQNADPTASDNFLLKAAKELGFKSIISYLESK